MEGLIYSLNQLNLELYKDEEEIYLEFLFNIGIRNITTQKYKICLSRLEQIYNLSTGGFVNHLDEIFLTNKVKTFKNKNNVISKEEFFRILLDSKEIYFYPNIPIAIFLKTDTPYKILQELNWITF